MSLHFHALIISTVISFSLASLFAPISEPSTEPLTPSVPNPQETHFSSSIFQTRALLDNAFNGRLLTGAWRSEKSHRAPFDYFDRQHGFTTIEAAQYFKMPNAETQMTDYFKKAQPIEALIVGKHPHRSLQLDDEFWIMLKIYDGDYIDMKAVFIQFPVNIPERIKFNMDDSTLLIDGELLEVQLKEEGFHKVLNRKCLTSLTLNFLDKKTGKPWDTTSKRSQESFVQYRLESEECGFEIIADDLENRGYANKNQVLVYATVMSLVGVLTCIGSSELRVSFRKRANGFRTSIGTLWFIATMDYYILIINFLLIFIYSPVLLIPTFVYFMLTFVFERKLVLECLEIQYGRSLSIAENEYRSCGFYFLALGAFFVLQLVCILAFRLWIVHVSALIFLPQIIYNFKRGKGYRPNFHLIVEMGLTRLGMVFYAKYYAENMFRLVPDENFVTVYTGIYVLQILVLLIQTKYPRLGFTKARKNCPSRVIYEDDLCSICMGHLQHPSCESKGALMQNRVTIETDCSHLFHLDCLAKWVVTKPECPVCRKNIQELIEDIECEEIVLARL